MQKGPTALGRPFPHKLFVYFAAHDIETQLIVPQDGPIGHIAEIGEGTRGKSHTAAGFFADGIDEGRDELLFSRETTPLSQMVPAFGARPKASSTSISADSP